MALPLRVWNSTRWLHRVTAVALVALAGLALMNGDASSWTVVRRAAAGEIAPGVPAYVRRGDEVEARYQAYRARVERFHGTLTASIPADIPDLSRKLEAARPQPVRHGYQVLPKLVPDAPLPAERPRAQSRPYSWPWTDRLIERETAKLERSEAELGRLATLPPVETRAAYEKLVAEYPRLAGGRRTIDAHLQYNRFWQRAIAHDKAGYDHVTALHDAVLERQAILDALGAATEAELATALGGIKGIDPATPRHALVPELAAREQELARQIRQAIARVTARSFLRVERPAPHRWIVHVPLYTDIEDTEFVESFKTAVERVWRLQDGEDDFGVALSISRVAPARLYGERAACGDETRIGCREPRKGDKIDLHQHLALFPKNGAVLTTGAISTHVTGSTIVLGPHDVAPHVLAHEFGHVLGFPDAYFRGYRDLGADGYLVMEVLADPDDIMGAPGTGVVRRGHFAMVIADVAARSRRPDGGSTSPSAE